MPTNPISTVFVICINRGIIDTVSLIAPVSFPHKNQLELYNKSSILKKIDNWNTKTTDINTITFRSTIQVKIHQTLTQLHSASHFKSKYIVFRDTQNKKRNKRKHNPFNNTHNNTEFRDTQNKKENKRKQNLFYQYP